ncbi:MAG: glycosyl hydrolase family 18 protein [Spirochaetota bacterium]
MVRPSIFLVLIVCVAAHPTAEAQPLWGYYLNGTLPYNTHTHYWDKTLTQLHTLCFTGITISKSCTIPSFKSHTKLFAKANQEHIQLLPHVTFTSVQSGLEFLTTQKYWENTIHTLETFIKQYNCAGLHFDFEYLPPQYAAHYAQFLKKVRAIVTGKIISAAVFPQVDFNTHIAAFHDFTQLSPYLDEIVLMCYDYHNPKTKPGPVTDIHWVKENVRYALHYFKPSQIWLGIPAYGYVWKNGKYHSVITMLTVHRYKALYRNYRHHSGTLCLTYTKNNDHYIAYVPDEETLQKLKNIALSYSLKGVALWRLGFE